MTQPYVPQQQQGFPQQAPQQAQAPAAQQPVPTPYNPYLTAQQAVPGQAPSGPVTQEQFASLVNTLNGHANQLANLTGAVNGLGANQEALHKWLVDQAQNLGSMVSSISSAIQHEGAIGFLRTLFTSAPQGGQAPQQQQIPQGYPQGQ